MALTRRLKKALIAGAVIPAFAACTFFAYMDIGYGKMGDQQIRSTTSLMEAENVLKEKMSEDKKWGAISDRITLQEWDENEVYDISHLDDVPFPSSVLPGFRKLEEASHRSVENQIKENKTDRTNSRMFALLQTRHFCDMAKKYTPAQITKDLTLVPATLSSGPEVIKNLPLYGEYCGIDAAPYKGALIKAQASLS